MTETNGIKYIDDFTVIQNIRLSCNYALIKLQPDTYQLSDCDIKPGQFAQIAISDNVSFLRRPISVCNIDNSTNALWLLVRNAGTATNTIINLAKGAKLNLLFPLGHGFSTDIPTNSSPLLIGGGVGVAPLLYLGRYFKQSKIKPSFLIGARTKNDLLLLDEFNALGDVHVTTDDGSFGTRGVVTDHSIINSNITHVYCCGPMPMMRAVAKVFSCRGIDCEVSLENVMGCGIGACLCCVEKTVDEGNVCVCTQGPVFKTSRLSWDK